MMRRLMPLAVLAFSISCAQVDAGDKPLPEHLWADLAASKEAAVHRAIMAMARASDETVVAFLKGRLRPVKVEPQRVTQLLKDLDSDRFATREEATEELEYLGKYVEAELKKTLDSKPSLEVTQRVQRLLSILVEEAGEVPAVQSWSINGLPVQGFPGGQPGFGFPGGIGGGFPGVGFPGAGFGAGAGGGMVQWGYYYPAKPAEAKEPVRIIYWQRAVRAIGVLEHIGTSEARALIESMARGEPDALPTREAKAALERLAAGR